MRKVSRKDQIWKSTGTKSEQKRNQKLHQKWSNNATRMEPKVDQKWNPLDEGVLSSRGAAKGEIRGSKRTKWVVTIFWGPTPRDRKVSLKNKLVTKTHDT